MRGVENGTCGDQFVRVGSEHRQPIHVEAGEHRLRSSGDTRGSGGTYDFVWGLQIYGVSRFLLKFCIAKFMLILFFWGGVRVTVVKIKTKL